ncbi:MAG: HxsD-like protein [Candidatus Binatia bacterium]
MADRITFDRSLYLPEAVEAAAAAYADYAAITLEPSAEAVAVVIADAGEHDVQTVGHAFANHVLHETIARRRQAARDEGI